MKICVLLIVFIQNLNAQEDDGILCSPKTCSDTISSSSCPPVAQNCTQNGLILPSPDPCNCCTYCLENKKEGDDCANGDVGVSIPDSICGPGLFCVAEKCVKMSELKGTAPPCSAAQAGYDDRRNNGRLGSMELRPNCDDTGYYKPYKCVPGQTCFCIDKNGKRIFGEISFTNTADMVLQCDCPRKYYEVLKFFDREVHPNEHFRCTQTGDYDTIQCIGSNCMCTDASDGAPTFPLKAPVNIHNISGTTLEDCFKKDIHEANKYYYKCAENYLKILEEVNKYKGDGFKEVFEVEYPSCDLDGTYAPVQKSIDSQTKEVTYFCAYPNGLPIGNYTATSADGMDCKCARSGLLLPEDAFERPQCSPNGNFNRIQCRRGKCFCVDSDGYQDTDAQADDIIEVDEDKKDLLFCATPTLS